MLTHTVSRILSRVTLNHGLIRWSFTQRNKAAQLILHSPAQIENMISRHEIKLSNKGIQSKGWKTSQNQGLTRFRVSLVGLPNCGKSSLFNCLIGEKIAIVDKHYGTTRDRKQFSILEGLASIIDTPGVETSLLKNKNPGGNLKEQIFKQTISAIHESHMILFVIDSKMPVSSAQMQFSKYLRTFGKGARIALVCNKCDGLYDEGEVINESSKLGFDEIYTVSSEEGTGVLELLNAINDSIPHQIRENYENKKKERVKKFEELIQRLKKEVQLVSKQKGFKMGEWQRDFRRLNPNPESNEALDNQNYEDLFVKPQEGFADSRGTFAKNVRMRDTIKICMIGRPNVGKSTLINEIIGQDKMVVSETAHTTRDSIRSRIDYNGRKIQLIDTAGLNTPRIQQNDEQYLRKVQISTMVHVGEAHVIVYLMDSFSAFVVDDFALIRKVIKEGKPVVIAVNKWEAIKDPYRYKAKNYLLKQIQRNMGEVHGDPLVFVSARMGFGITEMMDKVITAYDKWNTRISTGMLNNWFDQFKRLEKTPKDNNHTLNISYIIQARVRPPHFIFFVNTRSLFELSYERFLLRNMAKEFDKDGIPLRITVRSSNNRENKGVKKKERKQSKLKTKMEELKAKYGNFGI